MPTARAIDTNSGDTCMLRRQLSIAVQTICCCWREFSAHPQLTPHRDHGSSCGLQSRLKGTVLVSKLCDGHDMHPTQFS